MDSQTAVESFKFKSTHQKPSSFNIIETPIHYKPFATPTTTRNDLSFSTYLDNQQQSKHPQIHIQTTLDDSEINVFDAQKYFSDNNDSKEIKQLHLGSSASSSNNNIINPSDSVSRISSVSSSVDKYGRNFRVRSFHSTPTASSEASWNSQIGLLSKSQGAGGVLRNVSTDHHQHHSKKRSNLSSSSSSSSSSRGKWFFCRKCPCAGKKSLQVIEEQNCENYHRNERMMQLHKLSNISLKNSPERHQKPGFNSSNNNYVLSSNDILLKRVALASSIPNNNNNNNAFSFPVLKDLPLVPMRSKLKTSFEESARESLEVFQPPPHNISVSRKNIEDDVASDASSDLFEIESFSTQTPCNSSHNNNYRKRDSLDEASTLHSGRHGVGVDNFSSCIINDHEPITPRTECGYAPSEASIDWSVTTAEGFDKSSVNNFSSSLNHHHVSEYNEDSSTISRLRSMEKYGVGVPTTTSSNWKKGGGGGGNGGILGCRHEKAVNVVGPNPVKFVQDRESSSNHPSSSILPQLKISTGGHVSGGGATSRPPKPNLQQSSRTHARLSLAFAA